MRSANKVKKNCLRTDSEKKHDGRKRKKRTPLSGFSWNLHFKNDPKQTVTQNIVSRGTCLKFVPINHLVNCNHTPLNITSEVSGKHKKYTSKQKVVQDSHQKRHRRQTIVCWDWSKNGCTTLLKFTPKNTNFTSKTKRNVMHLDIEHN